MIRFRTRFLGYTIQLKIAEEKGGGLSAKIFKLGRVRSGSKFSRLLRYILENLSLKTLIGGNLAVLVAVSSFVSGTTTTFASEDIASEVGSRTQIILTTKEGIRYPVNDPKINQAFSFFHPGIDLGVARGKPVYPVMSGKIAKVGWSPLGYGNEIIINHGNGLMSLYAHLDKILVEEGQNVDITNEIGEVGSTGNATGPHVHLEIHIQGRAVNPLLVLSK